jgi:Acetoacetate decarboxylase (ADC)
MQPFTPAGRSAIAPPPPWHYASDVVAVEYWTDPDAVAQHLPPGVTNSGDGRAMALFFDWQFTADHDELLDPARYQYREALILLDASFEGMPIAYCPFIFVDNDSSLARGWAQGFPKRLGSIFQTRSFTVPGPASAPVAAGSRFGASVSAHGERLVDARVTLREPVTDVASVIKGPVAMRRYFSRLTAGDHERPAVNELTLSISDAMRMADVWQGEAELRIPEVPGEDMHALAPSRVGRGFRFGMSYTVTDLRILRDYTA